MAGGVVVAPDGQRKRYPGKMTAYVFLACLVASSGGLIFGYDIGISGGVTSMDSFLRDFFQSVYWKEKDVQETSQYCKFDSQTLIDRGDAGQAREMLRKIRGTDDIEEEFHDLVAASEASKLVKQPWKNFRQRKYRPQLVMSFMIPMFQQLTGINVILFKMPRCWGATSG